MKSLDFALTVWLGLLSFSLDAQNTGISELQPRRSDYTSMWWVDGFPKDGGRWLRAIQTGYYAFVMNTETLKVEHFGRITNAPNYKKFTTTSSNEWESLPSAKLELYVDVDGVRYTADRARGWSNMDGPRLVHSGRYHQTSDITKLRFIAPNGRRIGLNGRLEINAWPELLGLGFEVSPDFNFATDGIAQFGRVGSSLRLVGDNVHVVPDSATWNHSKFSLDFWVFLESDCLSATRHYTWVVGKGLNEHVDGSYGVVLKGQSSSPMLEAFINIGGGGNNYFAIGSTTPILLGKWTHVAISYDGSAFRFYINGILQGKRDINKQRSTLIGRSLYVGSRPDGVGYRFVGFIDQINYFNYVLTQSQVSSRFSAPQDKCAVPAFASRDFNDGSNDDGRVGGGFKVTSRNTFQVTNRNSELDTSKFAAEIWAQPDATPSSTSRWLFCKNKNSQTDGFYGVTIDANGFPVGWLNIRGTVIELKSTVKVNNCEWNHFVLQYDGAAAQFFVNGVLNQRVTVNKARNIGNGAFRIGRSCDDAADSGFFNNTVDDFIIYGRSLSAVEVKARFENPQVSLTGSTYRQSFGAQRSNITRTTERLRNTVVGIKLTLPDGRKFSACDNLRTGIWSSGPRFVSFTINTTSMNTVGQPQGISVTASEIFGSRSLPVTYNTTFGCFAIDLKTVVPRDTQGNDASNSNDSMERFRVVINNANNFERAIQLVFVKEGHITQFGSPITGLNVILRDTMGNPLGMPVQLSKNWHTDALNPKYSGQWLHGFAMLRLPRSTNLVIEGSIVYGHWGGVPAVSMSQLSLIGWGTNQLWNQLAIGSWGESACFEQDGVQADSFITDIRPLLVTSMTANKPQYSWTQNVGGGDFIKFFDTNGRRIRAKNTKAAYLKPGPCLSETIYSGFTADAIQHSIAVSFARTDDIVRGFYTVRISVTKDIKFSRFVVFQVGSDGYSFTREKGFAFGNIDHHNPRNYWETSWGGNSYKKRFQADGNMPYISLFSTERHPHPSMARGAWADRSIIIRNWTATLAGKKEHPWFSEFGVDAGGDWKHSTADVTLRPDLTELKKGDTIEAVFEHAIMPQSSADYYGPNQDLENALQVADPVKMVIREARENRRDVTMIVGTLLTRFPAVSVWANNNQAHFRITNGLGYVPVSVNYLTFNKGYTILVNGKKLDQSVHGNDFWQVDFDEETGGYQLTFNVPMKAGETAEIRVYL